MVNNKVQHYYTSVAGRKPDPANMEVAQIAVNLTDKRVFTKTESGGVITVGTGPNAVVEGWQEFQGEVTANGLTSNGSVTSKAINETGNSVNWFKDEHDKERAVIFAEPQTDGAGSLRVRVKNGKVGTANATYTFQGDGRLTLPTAPSAANHATRKDYVDSEVKKVNDRLTTNVGDTSSIKSDLDATKKRVTTNETNIKNLQDTRVKKAGDTMTGVLNIQNEPSANTTPILTLISDNTASPLRLRRKRSDENISIAFEGATKTQFLGTSTNGELHFGENINQSGNAKVYTTLHKPTKAEIGLGSVTNDAQVKKAGDTMTGNLTAPKVLVNSAQGSEANALTRKDYVDAEVKKANDASTSGVNTKVSKAGDTMIGSLNIGPVAQINFDDNGKIDDTPRYVIRAKTGANDFGYIAVGATAADKGYLEIGTQDGGDEPIYVRQRGANDVVKNSLTLLDASGATRIPGTTYIGAKVSIGNGTSDAYFYNSKSKKYLQLRDNGELHYDDGRVYTTKVKPTRTDVGLSNVENYRQARQYSVTPNTGASGMWVRIAVVKNPNLGSSRLALIIAGGLDSGQYRNIIDFVYLNGRGLTVNGITNTPTEFIQIRRMGNPNNADNVMKYGYVVDATGSQFEFYAYVPRYGTSVQTTVLEQAGSAEYVGVATAATPPTGLVNSAIHRLFDTYQGIDINTDLKGTLALNKGGTGATTAAAARTNLGLKNAALRDVGTASGQVMQVGAFGLGGKGKSYSPTDARDMLKQLAADGSSFARSTTTAGDSVYAMGAGFYSNVSDVHAFMSVNYNSGSVRVIATNDSNLNSATGRININTLYGTANKPTAAELGVVSITDTNDMGTY
ncbi:hypothetical protein [Klebsiella aerogenes]|uniref:hypothetical protein n=1 Tax=Klebsiella aerogenes TaxID=548 RepID=UPI002278B69B|nr:hypothetical protein [Klebsiella aerogenes]MCY4762679.1 hypothetical protein [Klebsiella aerogenes]